MNNNLILKPGLTYTGKSTINGFDLTKWLKHTFINYNIPFVDPCCDTSSLPVRFESNEENLQYYDPITKDWITISTAGIGTVTSVGLSAPEGFIVTNSPIQSSGNINLNFASGYSLPTNISQDNWNTAYDNSIISATFTGTTTKTLTLNQQNGGSITASFTDTSGTTDSTFIGTLNDIRNLDLGTNTYKQFVTTDYGVGFWYYDQFDTTTPDNIGTVLVTADGKRIKRVGNPTVLSFGAISDYDYNTQTGTDNTLAFQRTIDYIISIGGGDIVIPPGFYNIAGTLYINSKPIPSPINIIGPNVLAKDQANNSRGAALIKKNTGDVFKVNQNPNGTPFVTGGLTYQLNVSFSGFSIEGSETEETYGIRVYRTRGHYSNLGFKVLDAGIMQDELRPSSYPTGTWDNYCDQSTYSNITMYRMKKYGLYLSAPDSSTIQGIRYEYPNVSAIYGIRIHHGSGFTIKDILHSNGNNEMTEKANSYFLWIKESSNFTVEGLINENNRFEANIYLDRCKGFVVSGVGEKYISKDIFRLQGCREFVLMGVTSEANKVAGYYDINDNSAFPSVGLSWAHFRLEAPPGQPVVVRPILTNFTPDANRGHYENYEKITADIIAATINKVDTDTYVLANPNYSNTPNYALTSPAYLVLGDITQNTTFSIPASSLFGGKRFIIKNINTSAFSWTLSGSVRMFDGTSTNVFPNGTVTELAASADGSVLPIAWYVLTRNNLPATTSSLGLIQLTGEFGGTGTSPVITNINSTKITKTYTQIATNADYVAPANGYNQYYQLPGITANRTFTLPTSVADGRSITIFNRNGTVNNWITNLNLLNPDGSTTNILPNNSVITLTYGVGNWRLEDVYSTTTTPNATLTGDITGTGPLSAIPTTITNNSVTFAKIQQLAALSVLGNSTNTTANSNTIIASADGNVLRRSGTTLGFGTIGNNSISDLDYNKLTNIPAVIPDTLQSVTTGLGNNITNNTIQVTGINNLNSSIESLVFGYNSQNGIISKTNTTGNGNIVLSSNGNVNFSVGNTLNAGNSPILTLEDTTGTGTNIATFNGRVKADPAIAPDELIRLDQANLQNITTGVGNNTTSNAIQVSNQNNFTFTDSMIMSYNPSNKVGQLSVLRTGGDPLSIISLGTDNFSIGIGSGLALQGNASAATPFSFNDNGVLSRVQGADGVDLADFVTVNQLENSLAQDRKGGQSMFTANGTTTTFDIIHNLGIVPSYFTLTTTTPITLNHLNRNITFPDNNTMRITFNNPPLVGEDVNYVWIVYR